jgi:hypothetical protein
MAPISPWFNTHYGPEVSYSKNWVFPSDLLWFRRWNDILTLGARFVEIITWNDYGESHYIGPLSSLHYDDGNSKWTNDMPHDGWQDLAKPFIAAYKASATDVTPFITEDQLIYWYRPTLSTLDCDATDTTMVPANNDSGNYFEGRPSGYNTMADAVFVVALLTSPGTVSITSGSNSQSFEAPAGATAYQIDMQVGQQSFSLKRGTTTVLSGASLKDVSAECICGIYNFNAFVGTLPAGTSDPLGSDGLASLTVGLHVSTCSATPTLGTAPAAVTAIPATTTSVRASSTPSPTSTSTKLITTSKTSSSASSPTASQVCISGTGSGNYAGLCSFSCQYGYCPTEVCSCTAYGSQIPAPPTNGKSGYPLPGEGESYAGLCGYSCNHGYCPETACTYGST